TDRRGHQQPHLPDGRGRRHEHRHLGVRALPAARRSLGQARATARARPPLSARRAGELRAIDRQPRRVSTRRLHPPAAQSLCGSDQARQGISSVTGKHLGAAVSEPSAQSALIRNYTEGVLSRLGELAAQAEAGAFDAAIDILVTSIERGGVIQAFGTGHSEAFAMEIAGRAGGLIPTNKIALRDVVLRGSLELDALSGGSLERNPDIADELYELTTVGPDDAFIIASNSGVNGSIVGLALAATSHDHTMKVEPKHASGKRLRDVADVVLDNLAPYGDATQELSSGVPVGAVSSITAAYIAQVLTIGVAERIAATGTTPPLYISANIPGGDEHNRALEALYEGKLNRTA